MGDRICVMKDGRIMQVADPTTLYERPANAFVAGFIGMPEMNLVRAVLTRPDGLPALTLDGQTVTMAEGLAHRLTASDGPVIMGIRPQHLATCTPGTPGALTGEIVTVEFMGHEVNLHVRIGDETLVAVTPTEVLTARPERGEHIGLRPDGHRMHLFDTTSEANISLATQD